MLKPTRERGRPARSNAGRPSSRHAGRKASSVPNAGANAAGCAAAMSSTPVAGISLTASTVFANTKLPLRRWFLSADDLGMALGRQLGVDARKPSCLKERDGARLGQPRRQTRRSRRRSQRPWPKKCRWRCAGKQEMRRPTGICGGRRWSTRTDWPASGDGGSRL